VFGAWAAAWPTIRDELGLSYVAVGVLIAVPQILGNIIEPPLGLLGDGWNRRALVRGGGIAFALALLLIALSGGFATLLIALILVNPASGAFVALSQVVLMDLDGRRREQNMARWALAGSLGMVIGPFVIGAAVLAGLGWRTAFGTFAVFALALLAAVWRLPMPMAAEPEPHPGRALLRSAREAVHALRDGTAARWLTLLQFSDLMLDVFYGFLALYFVDVVGVSGAGAVVALVVWTGVGLVGDALLIPLIERVDSTRYLRAAAVATLVVFPAFLIADDVIVKLTLVGVLGLLNSGWYAILQARVYDAMPGRSATVMALSSLFGIAGGLLPFCVAVAAQQFGLGAAMWLLLAGPIALLVGVRRTPACATLVQSSTMNSEA
jgi:MFS transporter, FSR family, fosmidomycin resistance protein